MTVIRVEARGATVEAVAMGSCPCGLVGVLESKRCALQLLFAQSRSISLLLSSAAARVVAAQHLQFGGPGSDLGYLRDCF